jgi:hypothetical protein
LLWGQLTSFYIICSWPTMPSSGCSENHAVIPWSVSYLLHHVVKRQNRSLKKYMEICVLYHIWYAMQWRVKFCLGCDFLYDEYCHSWTYTLLILTPVCVGLYRWILVVLSFCNFDSACRVWPILAVYFVAKYVCLASFVFSDVLFNSLLSSNNYAYIYYTCKIILLS